MIGYMQRKASIRSYDGLRGLKFGDCYSLHLIFVSGFLVVVGGGGFGDFFNGFWGLAWWWLLVDGMMGLLDGSGG